MPRQPFLSIYKPGMSYSIGPGDIGRRPELASLVGQCIAMWNDAELQIALALGAILKTNSDAAVALYLSIKTSRTQREALTTVADLVLSGGELTAFKALLRVYSGVEKQRNALAHGLFGVADDHPDALLWSDIQDHANFLINVYLKDYQGNPNPDPHEKLRKDMYVYRRSDLEDLLREMTELQKAAFHFHCHHQPRPEPRYDHMADLIALPCMQKALKELASP